MTIERDFEIASLLKDRWYIILQKNGDEGFRMSAYDTTDLPDDDDYVDSGFVAQQGIIELLENDFERIIEAGLARISFNEMQETLLNELEEEGVEPRELVTERIENVLKVDFGTKFTSIIDFQA